MDESQYMTRKLAWSYAVFCYILKPLLACGRLHIQWKTKVYMPLPHGHNHICPHALVTRDERVSTLLESSQAVCNYTYRALHNVLP